MKKNEKKKNRKRRKKLQEVEKYSHVLVISYEELLFLVSEFTPNFGVCA